MPKFLLFFADGTWNGPDRDELEGKSDPTNVYKLFSGLEGFSVNVKEHVDETKEIEKLLTEKGQVVQMAKYIHGVGDSKNSIKKILGGVFGAGIISRIIRGYTFISRNYERDDQIILVGFSRGAYTVRALAGMIAAEGLLKDAKWLAKDDAYRMGIKVWHRYQKQRQLGGGVFSNVVDAIVNKVDFLNQVDKNDLIPVPSIAALAVWDTVGSLGIPGYYKDKRIDVFKFADTNLSSKVQYGFHALALDEQREDFTPTFWKQRENVVQMVFPGAHSDVGGGYPADNHESELSDIALQWMTKNLAALGVRVQNPPYFPFNPDVRGVAHKPWLEEPFDKLGVALRNFRGQSVMGHESIEARMHIGMVAHAPFEASRRYKPVNWMSADVVKQINTYELMRSGR